MQHQTASLPSNLRKYGRLLEKCREQALEEVSISPDESSEEDSCILDPVIVEANIRTQSETQLETLFSRQQHIAAPVDAMLGMSPLSKAKFRHRTDSADWGHLSPPTSPPISPRSPQEEEKDWSMDDFNLGKTLGRGRFASVYLATEKSSGSLVVLKAIKKSCVTKYRAEKALRNEIEVQSHLDHPNILKLYTFFHDNDRIFLVLEYAALGDLFTMIQRKRITHDLAARYIHDIASALHYMHENFIIHRDLKPENIFVNHLGQVKIADFGWSIHSHKQSHIMVVGTTQYMAPEMLRGYGYNCSADIWSLGVVLYEFVTGKEPFSGETHNEIAKRILGEEIAFPSEPVCPAQCTDLLSRLLDRNPNTRIGLLDVMSHPWITSTLLDC